MSEETTTTDHTETIEIARDLLDKVTPRRWEIDRPAIKNTHPMHAENDSRAIAAVPDLLEALDAVARERDELRERVRELEVKMYVSNLMTDARARKIALEEVIEWLKTNKDATP